VWWKEYNRKELTSLNNKKYKNAGGATFLTFMLIIFLALWLTNRR
jgi:hypothetical protein